MKIKIVLIASLLSLVIASCESQQVIPTVVSTNIFSSTTAPTFTPNATPTFVLMPDGLIMMSPNRYKFLIWPLSFSLPNGWDINNKYHLSSTDVGRETYTFYRDDIVDTHSMNESPKITIRFATISDEMDIKTFSEETLTDWHSTDMSDTKVTDSEGIEVSLDATITYKTYFTLEDVEYTKYIVHAIYQTMGIEIIMVTKTEIFENIESEFLYFLKNLSFE